MHTFCMSCLVSLNWLYMVAPSTTNGRVSGRMHSRANSQHAACRSGNSNILAALIIPSNREIIKHINKINPALMIKRMFLRM